MNRIKKFLPVLIAVFLITAVSCKKKKADEEPDARKALYSTWTISGFESPDADSTAIAQIQSTSITFNEDGKLKMGELTGTFTAKEDASEIAITMNGNTETYLVSGLTSSGMTLAKGAEKMVLTK